VTQAAHRPARGNNRRTALVLASIALVFFIGIVIRYMVSQ
jgi:hypothetical protein